MADRRCTFKLGRWNCGSYQFNLYKDGIDQGDLCDVHYWQDRAHRAEAQPPLPVQEPEYEYLIDELVEWTQYVEADNAPYGLREHVTKVLLAHNIKEKNT